MWMACSLFIFMARDLIGYCVSNNVDANYKHLSSQSFIRLSKTILCAHVKGLHRLTAALFPSLFHSAILTETAATDQEHDSLVAEGKN